MLGVGSLLAIVLANFLLNNPFRAMLEGKGLLTLNIDSTGILRPFISSLSQPYIKGRLGGDDVNDVYDRSTVIQMAAPVVGGKAIYDGKTVKIEISEDDFNRSRFGLYQYPTMIYNAQIKSLLTKDVLSDTEKDSFAEHGILYLNRKLEELTSIVRDFGRYVVELTKPKDKWYNNKFFWIVLIVGAIILLLLFAKPVIEAFMGMGGSAGSAVGKVFGGGPVVPR